MNNEPIAAVTPNPAAPQVFRNPIPVAVAVLPVAVDDGYEFVCVKRGNKPCVGEWALPGGYVDEGENVFQAVCREMNEETQFDCIPEDWSIVDCHTNASNRMMIFCLYNKPIEFAHFKNFNPSIEVLDLGLQTIDKLCFPTHKLACEKFLKELAPKSDEDLVARKKNKI